MALISELDQLPFAAQLEPHTGGLTPDTMYDCAHFDKLSFDSPDGAACRFLECAFTRGTFSGGQLRRADFSEVWLRDVRVTGTGLMETRWSGATLIGVAVAGVEAYGARLGRVTLQDCKLDSVNLRDTSLTEVTFANCVLNHVDFGGAKLTRTSFPGSRLAGCTFTQMTMDEVDLRGAELGITLDTESLCGAIVSASQLTELASLLAASMGIRVEG